MKLTFHTSQTGCWQIVGTLPRPMPLGLVLETDAGHLTRDRGQRVLQSEGLQFTVAFASEGAWLRADCRLQLDVPVRVDFLGVALGPLALGPADRFFGEVPGFFEHSGVAPALEAQSQQRVASLFGLVDAAGRGAWLGGIGGLQDEPSGILLRSDRLLVGCRPARRMPVGDYRFTLRIGHDADPLVLLERFGETLKPLARPLASPPTGWNSWDFYASAVSMRDLRAEMRALDSLACRPALRYLTLDMGWEQDWGDWTPNRRFPARLERIAAAIRTGGWRPGIWTAPLQVSQLSPLARYRQELFLRDAEGSPVIVETGTPRGPALLLDFSLPEVQALVGQWYAVMRQAGFELFKIDYLYSQFIAHARHAAGNIGKTAFVRAIFRTLREAIGPDAHLLNCGGLKEAAIGYADSARVTMDIHNFWGHIRNNARQLARAFWMNGKLWVNDPDFAIIRTPQNCRARYLNFPHATGPLTEQTFWMRGPPATQAELRLWLSLVRLNGGSLFLSDPISTLRDGGRADLERMFPPLEAGFVPLDLFERTTPSVWWSRDARRPTVGLFNFEEQPLSLALPAPLRGGLRGREFWTGATVRIDDTVDLSPRTGMLLEV